MAHFNSKWTVESLQEEASKYTTLKDFRQYSKGAYLAAHRRGITKDITSHMKVLRTSWTLEAAIKAATKYQTLTDFHSKCPGAYNYLRKNDIDIKDLITPIDKSKWTITTIFEEALKYSTRNSFKNGCSSAYGAALKLDIIDSVTSHMDTPQKEYTYEELRLEALKYNTRTEFKRGNYGMYQSACRKGIIDDIGSHMQLNIRSFQPMKPAILYYFKIMDVWKIGITNYTLEDRYYKRDRDKMSEIKTWNYELGADALSAEKHIKEMYKEYLYKGPTPFTDGTGTTECFIIDIMHKEIEK